MLYNLVDVKKAVFYDRDGIIVQMVYDAEYGTIDVVRKKEEIEFVPGIIELLKYTHGLGYLNIIISNQPVIGLGRTSKENFDELTKVLLKKIERLGAVIDADYYCFHHPFAKIDKYRIDCDCRKPKPGLIRQAGQEFDIDLSQSWMIGDGVNDVKAGKAAGCRTILLGNLMESEYLRVLEQRLEGVKPDFIIKKIDEVMSII